MIKSIKAKIGNEKIFSFPFSPNFYFELKKQNPYPNSFLIEKQYSVEQFENNLRILKSEKPKYIITDYSLVKKYHHTFTNPIDIYLRENYSKIKQIGSIDLWEKSLN